MSERDSTAPLPSDKPARVRPSKPYPEFPLTPHPAGYWCKKIRGKVHYFGPWGDPDGAMGHEVPHMSSVYRETISDARLRAVTEHVRAWLFGAHDDDKKK